MVDGAPAVHVLGSRFSLGQGNMTALVAARLGVPIAPIAQAIFTKGLTAPVVSEVLGGKLCGAEGIEWAAPKSASVFRT